MYTTAKITVERSEPVTGPLIQLCRRENHRADIHSSCLICRTGRPNQPECPPVGRLSPTQWRTQNKELLQKFFLFPGQRLVNQAEETATAQPAAMLLFPKRNQSSPQKRHRMHKKFDFRRFSSSRARYCFQNTPTFPNPTTVMIFGRVLPQSWRY